MSCGCENNKRDVGAVRQVKTTLVSASSQDEMMKQVIVITPNDVKKEPTKELPKRLIKFM